MVGWHSADWIEAPDTGSLAEREALCPWSYDILFMENLVHTDATMIEVQGDPLSSQQQRDCAYGRACIERGKLQMPTPRRLCLATCSSAIALVNWLALLLPTHMETVQELRRRLVRIDAHDVALLEMSDKKELIR